MAVPEFVQSLWARLQRRDKWPRSWWYPLQDRSPQKPADETVQKDYEECVLTVRRTMLVLLGFSLFCIVTALGTPDSHLVTAEAKIKLPFADADIASRYFLLAAPLLLIVLTIYLHVFDNKRLKLAASYKVSHTPTLFTLNEPLPNALTQFIFFWLVPFVLAAITWKALARLEWGLPLLAVTIVMTASLVWMQIRRCPAEQRLLNLPHWAVLSGLVCVAAFAAWDREAIRRSLNLYRANLAGEWLIRADLQNAHLQFANLQGADLDWANLQGANLFRAYLEGANLFGANLRRANLAEANLQGAHLNYANLEGAGLIRASLQGANLADANLPGAHLNYANLEGADLNRADLRNADLEDAKIWLTRPSWVRCCENAKLDFLVETPSGEAVKALQTSLENIADDRVRKRVAARLEKLLDEKARQSWKGSEDYQAWVSLRGAERPIIPSIGSDDEKSKKPDSAVEANQP